MLNITHHDVFFLNRDGLSCSPSGKIHTPHFDTTNLGNAGNKLTQPGIQANPLEWYLETSELS